MVWDLRDDPVALLPAEQVSPSPARGLGHARTVPRLYPKGSAKALPTSPPTHLLLALPWAFSLNSFPAMEA